TGKLRRAITGSQPALTSVAYSPDGKLLASSSMDGTVVLWDAEPMRAMTSVDVKLSKDKLDSNWEALGGMDGSRAYQSMCELAQAPSQTVAMFKDRLQGDKTDSKHIEQLIANLGSDKPAERERATRELGDLGRRAETALRQADQRQPSPEARKR